MNTRIFMITDEVICGFGRTGKMFGVEHWDVVPDLMSVAKGITSGYIQLGAVMMSEKLRDELAEMSEKRLFPWIYLQWSPNCLCSSIKKYRDSRKRESCREC